jgi:hypothetical protein
MHEQWLIGDDAYVRGAGYDPEELRAERQRYSAPMQEASARMLDEYLSGLPR